VKNQALINNKINMTEEIVNVDDLMKKVRLKVCEQIDSKYELSNSLKIAQNKLILGQAKKLLKSAQDRNAVRTKWPDKLNQFPFNFTLIFKPIVLKLLSALFKDQREVNNNLIAACNISILLNERLLEEMEKSENHDLNF
jgi:O-antigen chain-terminating methyltransferase